MLRLIQGKNIGTITLLSFKDMIQGFENIVIDIGTGDGKFVYQSAKSNKSNFYIGIDPNQKALEKTGESQQNYIKKKQKEDCQMLRFFFLQLKNYLRNSQILQIIFLLTSHGAAC